MFCQPMKIAKYSVVVLAMMFASLAIAKTAKRKSFYQSR